MDVFVGIMTAIVIAAGIVGFRMEHGSDKRIEEQTENGMLKEQEKG